MSDADDADLCAALRRMRWTPGVARRRRCVYRGAADFILREGEAMQARPLSMALQRGPVGLCFANAILTSARTGLPYVEGFVWHPRIVNSGRVELTPAGEPVPIHHAWNLDRDGFVQDVTIPDHIVPAAERQYRGVRFAARTAHKATWDLDASVLAAEKHGWPVLRRPHVPEESPGDVSGLMGEIHAIAGAPNEEAADALIRALREGRG